VSRRCKACGTTGFRKATLALVLLRGAHEGGLVCPECARSGVLLVASRVAPVIRQETAKPEALRRVLARLATYAKAASTATPEDARLCVAEHRLGRYEGIQTAIEVLKREFAT